MSHYEELQNKTFHAIKQHQPSPRLKARHMLPLTMIKIKNTALVKEKEREADASRGCHTCYILIK